MSKSISTAVSSGDAPCTEKCRSTSHGREICRIALHGTDEEVLALWMKTCVNYGHVKDEFGRNALHIAASLGRLLVVEWLIKREGSQINLRDFESGYSPLHRSIFYGQISSARLLIKLGADITIKDNEGLTPLDLTLAWRNSSLSNAELEPLFNAQSEPTELYVWGRNQNFNLGIENQQDRVIPEILEKFGADNERIEHVTLQQFHSLFKTQLGALYVCGHGEGGRLGSGSENASLTPRKISSDTDKVSHVSASTNHTVVVYENGVVATSGSNEFAVLGHNPPLDKVLSLKVVHFGSRVKILKCAASNFHSVFYNQNDVYICGTNEGQFGHLSSQGTKIYKPIKIASLSIPHKNGNSPVFDAVACNDVATAVMENLGDSTVIHLFFNHTTFVLKMGMLKISRVSVLGGFRSKNMTTELASKFRNEPEKAEGPLTLVFLNGDDIYIWRQDSSKLQRKTTGCPSIAHAKGEGTLSKVLFNTSRQTGSSAQVKGRYAVKDFCVPTNSLLFVTKEGTAYISMWSYKNVPVYLDSKTYRCVTSADNELKLIDSGFRVQNIHKKIGTIVLHDVTLELLKAKRIPNIYLGEKIVADLKGNNFAAILQNPRHSFTELPWEDESIMLQNVTSLLTEVNEEDNIHDVVFEVEGHRFPAHRFIIASRCTGLYLMIKNSKSHSAESNSVLLKNVHPIVFEQTLKFIYTSSCDVTSSYDGTFKCDTEHLDLIRELLSFAKRINLNEFWEKVKHFELRGDAVHLKSGSSFPNRQTFRFCYPSHMDICDVTLKCSDGEEIRAHRCILASRVNYFQSIFSFSWYEEKSTKPFNIAHSKFAVKAMLEFVYGDNLDSSKDGDVELLTDILSLADEFLLQRLVSQVECQMASRLNLRNVLNFLKCSDIYNATQLKKSCYEFLSPHVSQLLENRALDQLDKLLINELTEYYKANNCRDRKGIRVFSAEWMPLREEYEKALESVSPDLQLMLQDLDKGVRIEYRRQTPKSSKVKIRTRTVSETEEEGGISEVSTLHRQSFDRESVATEGIGELLDDSDPFFFNDQREKTDAHNKISKTVFPMPTQKLQSEPKKALNLAEFPSLGSAMGSPLSVPLSLDFPSTSKSSPTAAAVKKKRKWKSLDEKENIVRPPVSPSDKVQINPWIKPWEQVAEVETRTKTKGFKVIVEEEEERKSNFEKAVSKPMALLIVEDAAMTKLLKLYTTADVTNSVETISVERVCPESYAEPTWVSQTARP